MKLWEVSTSSFHTWIVRAVDEAEARSVAWRSTDGTDTSECGAADLGYDEQDWPSRAHVTELAVDGDAEIVAAFS